MGIIHFRVGSGEPRCGYLAGSYLVDLVKGESYNLIEALPKPPDAERPLYYRRDVTLLYPVDPGMIVCFDNSHRHDVTNGYDPHLGDLSPRETLSPTTSFATNGTEIPLSAMSDDVRPGVELRLVISEQAWLVASDCCLVSEYHEQCVRVGS